MTSTPPGSPSGQPIPVQFVKGIGPRRSSVLSSVGINTVLDLLFYVPRRYLDRSSVMNIADIRRRSGTLPLSSASDAMEAADIVTDRGDVTVVGTVRSFRVAGVGRKSRFVLVLADRTGSLQCVWFGGVQYWKKAFEIGETLAVSGQPTYYGGILQFVHPAIDRISPRSLESDEPADDEGVDWEERLHTGGLVPLYPSTQELARVGFDSAGFRRVIRRALQDHLQSVRETLPPDVLSRRALKDIHSALQEVHFPGSLEALKRALERLKYEEFFRFQVKLALKRRLLKDTTGGVVFDARSALARQLVDSLPFSLTKAQLRVVREITGDMASMKPMNRLLQGDVGSGKTVVALIAMLIAVDNGYQAAFMAPTEILAEQHYRSLTQLSKDLSVGIRLLVGAQRSTLRRDILEDVRRGSVGIVVGTHALFEKEVEFARLGLVVIDEQHRFGVMQRAAVRAKGVNPDVLVMTATPIPRTLSLTLYGDLDVSVIDELPGGRKPITTALRNEREKAAVHAFVREQVRRGRQAYFVYPLIEESEKVDLKAATVHYRELQEEVFPDLNLGLIHGRMSSEQKDDMMARFKKGEIDILVATTVIEVGIDVPNATVMVIENSERFGLAQLHQLRGRVGRGSEQSYCILLASSWVVRGAARHSDPVRAREAAEEQRQAERRLATMVRTTDGFVIAEEDLQIRGPGDFFGTRQSGIPEFRVANILTDTVILDAARSDAFAIIDADPHLARPEHRQLLLDLRSYLRDELSLLSVG